MIVVTVELHSAITGKVSVIGRTIIHNVGTSADGRLGDYQVAVANRRDATGLRAILQRPQRRGEVRQYPRLSYNVWRLVIRALRSAFPEEKSEASQ